MPDSKPGDELHPVGVWWRRWSGLIALGLLIAITAGGWLKLEREGDIREEQFCSLVLSSHNDRVTRLEITKDFLETPAGEEPTALNIYIKKVSVPQTEEEITKEARKIPGVCRKYEATK